MTTWSVFQNQVTNIFSDFLHTIYILKEGVKNKSAYPLYLDNFIDYPYPNSYIYTHTICTCNAYNKQHTHEHNADTDTYKHVHTRYTKAICTHSFTVATYAYMATTHAYAHRHYIYVLLPWTVKVAYLDLKLLPHSFVTVQKYCPSSFLLRLGIVNVVLLWPITLSGSLLLPFFSHRYINCFLSVIPVDVAINVTVPPSLIIGL